MHFLVSQLLYVSFIELLHRAEYKHASLISYSSRLRCLEATDIGKHRFVSQQTHREDTEHNEAIIRAATLSTHIKEAISSAQSSWCTGAGNEST